MQEGSFLEYTVLPSEEIDVQYFSKVLGVRVKDPNSTEPVPELGKDVRFARLVDQGPLFSALSKCESVNAKKKKLAVADGAVLFEKLIDKLYAFPCPVYSSPLRMALDKTFQEEGTHTPILLDSFSALHRMCEYERLVFLAASNVTTLDARKQVQSTREKFLDRISVHTRIEGGLHHVMQMPRPPNVDTEMALIKENFYNIINAIRVLEFTVLDYLGIAEQIQASYASYASASVPRSVTIKNPCWQDIGASLKQMIVSQPHWKQRGEKEIRDMQQRVDACSSGGGDDAYKRFVPAVFLQIHFEYVHSNMSKSYLFPCSNAECKEVETSSQKRFARCAKCQWCRYHSKECQVKHWTSGGHKNVCQKKIPLEDLDKERLLIGSGQGQ